MKKIILILLFVFSLVFSLGMKTVNAAEYGGKCDGDSDCTTGLCRTTGYCGCASDAHCYSGSFCNANNLCQVGSPTSTPTTPDEIFGEIQAPPGVAEFNAQADGGIGIIVFFSNLIKLIAVVAGLWTMLNFILAGFTYVTAGDNSSAIEKIGTKLTMSVVGLGIIVASYTIAALIGLILFGDATFIINPQIPTPII
jgi:hypothetical protein